MQAEHAAGPLIGPIRALPSRRARGRTSHSRCLFESSPRILGTNFWRRLSQSICAPHYRCNHVRSHQAARGSRKTAACVCTALRHHVVRAALRSFLNYLRYRGDVTINLSAAVPRVANWSMPSISRSIAPSHLRRVLASCNRRSAVGSRDYAIYCCSPDRG